MDRKSAKEGHSQAYSAALASASEAASRGEAAAVRAFLQEALAGCDTGDAQEHVSWTALALNDGDMAIRAREAAYRCYRQEGNDVVAARMAMWVAKDYEDFRGELAIARGWRKRARRLLEGQPVAPEHGWLPILECWASLTRGEDPDEVKRCTGEALAVSRQCGDTDLGLVARSMEGVAMVGEGSIDEGMARLDEAAAAVLGGDLQEEMWALVVFCMLIHACQRVRDFGRAAQWCQMMREEADRMRHTGSQGICRAHYGAVLTSCGAWAQAEETLRDAVGYFEASWPPRAVEARVHLAELRRRQGRPRECVELLRPVEWYPLASLGLAEVALGEGRVQEAEERMERFLRLVPKANRLERAAGLELLVRVCVQADHLDRARRALGEMEAVADLVPTSPLRAAACCAKAVVCKASGDKEAARVAFEDAVALFERSGMPYEASNARLELAEVLVGLGRDERARDEAEEARARGQRLGAGPLLDRARATLARLDPTARTKLEKAGAPPLTTRQIEVLQLISQGMGDAAIGATLGISEHTVHRHVANILQRLDAPTRAAAAAKAAALGLL